MPIVDVQLVRATDLDLRADLAAMLADALGEVFGAEPRRVWVRLAVLAAQHYAENAATYPLAEMPVFVTVLHAVPPEGQTRAAEALVIAQVVAKCVPCSRELVHVEYAPPGHGRIAFGGKLVQ